METYYRRLLADCNAAIAAYVASGQIVPSDLVVDRAQLVRALALATR